MRMAGYFAPTVGNVNWDLVFKSVLELGKFIVVENSILC